jgi:hypothetical protein
MGDRVGDLVVVKDEREDKVAAVEVGTGLVPSEERVFGKTLRHVSA